MAKIASKSVIVEGGQTVGAEVVFANGERVAVKIADLNSDIQERALVHGLLQKLGDSYSGCGGDVNVAQAECQAVAESLLNGDWNRRGDGVSSDLAEALANIVGKSIAEAQAAIAGLSKEQKDALAKRPDVKAEVLKIKAARASAKAEASDGADLGALFG